MTSTVYGVHEAKTHLSRLLQRVEAGEEVQIARRGTVVARLVPARPAGERTFGVDAGRLVVPDDFDTPLPEDVLADFAR
jgi:prevent-host-death family protein